MVEQKGFGFGERVLVLDDSLTVRKIVAKAVIAEGFEVDECNSANNALKKLELHCYDIVFVALSLPDLSITEFLDELLGDVRYARLPVILMSSKSAEIQRLSKYRDNVVSTLIKPFSGRDIQYLLKTLKNASIEEGNGSVQQLIESFEGKDSEEKVHDSHDRVFSEIDQVLKKGLGRVASLIPQLEIRRESVEAKDYFLPYLMHPDLVSGLRKCVKSSSESLISQKKISSSGPVKGIALFDLLRHITDHRSSGKIVLESNVFDVELWIHKGLVLGVTAHDAAQYISGLDLNLESYDKSEVSRLAREQRETGRPIVLSLVSGKERDLALMDTLIAASRNLINRVLSSDCSFCFWGNEMPPEWASENSLGENPFDLFLDSLRLVRGWDQVSEELGDLSVEYGHRYSRIPYAIRSHLNSFESVVCDFFKYGYTVSELAVTLGESPSRIAEASYLLIKLGLIRPIHGEQGGYSPVESTSVEEVTVMLVTSDEGLKNSIISCIEDEEVHFLAADNVKNGLILANRRPVDLLITDGIADDHEGLEIVKKLKQANPALVWIYAEPKVTRLHVTDIIGLRPVDGIERPFNLSSISNSLSRGLDRVKRKRMNQADRRNDYFEILNDRLAHQKQLLSRLEHDLQKRENELLRNEEIFYHKCNLFEEERARLDLLSDQYAQ